MHINMIQICYKRQNNSFWQFLHMIKCEIFLKYSSTQTQVKNKLESEK